MDIPESSRKKGDPADRLFKIQTMDGVENKESSNTAARSWISE
jgi:hypothetical protein